MHTVNGSSKEYPIFRRTCYFPCFFWSDNQNLHQGIAQGCISGISSFANIISPFIFSPLTGMVISHDNIFFNTCEKCWILFQTNLCFPCSDLFLSKRAPFYFPGFSIMCSGFATVWPLISKKNCKVFVQQLFSATLNLQIGCSHSFIRDRLVNSLLIETA